MQFQFFGRNLGQRQKLKWIVQEAKSHESFIVGVNCFVLDDEPDIEVLKVDNAEVRAAQIARLVELRSDRNDASTNPKDWYCVECPIGASCVGNIN